MEKHMKKQIVLIISAIAAILLLIVAGVSIGGKIVKDKEGANASPVDVVDHILSYDADNGNAGGTDGSTGNGNAGDTDGSAGNGNTGGTDGSAGNGNAGGAGGSAGNGNAGGAGGSTHSGKKSTGSSAHNAGGSSGNGSSEDDSPNDDNSDDDNSGNDTPGSGSSDNGSVTQRYEVSFALGDGQSAAVTLPQTAAWAEGTAISSLPTPAGGNSIFLGWYYDAGLTDGVKAGDTVNRTMTLYAKTMAGEALTSLETPESVTRTDVPAGSYTFSVLGAADPAAAIRFINITGGNSDVEYQVNGSTVSAVLEAGQTYQVELTDEAAQLQLADESEAQPVSVRRLNILTAKAVVTNASLNSGVKRISVRDTQGLDEGVFAGLYQIDTRGRGTENSTAGTFTYTGGVAFGAGDTVAILSEGANLDDVTSTEGHVAYVKIISVDGAEYTYEMADVEDVLFIPDVLPIESGWDLDTTDSYILTVSAENLDTAMQEVDADSLDVGDFLGFLETAYSEGMTSAASYGQITEYVIDGDGNFVITYTVVDEEKIEDSLDVYYTQNREISLTEAEKSGIESEIKQDVADSGYVEEAALYLAAVMLESNNLSEIPDMESVNEGLCAMRTASVQNGSGIVTRSGGGNSVSVRFDTNNIYVSVAANRRLEHLVGTGFDVAVNIPFDVTIGSGENKIQIKVTASFEEEVILKQRISTKRHRKGFLKYDYSLNASFEVGNYTGIGFRADLMTADSGSEALGEQLREIMQQMENYQNGMANRNDGTMDSLSEIYQEVMEKANDAWIDILDVKLFENNGNAFLHIFCWQVKGSFVVSANLCASMGMEFDYTTQKQYNFSVRVKAKTASNEAVDIIEPHYNFNFYVVGSVGIRAGLRLEMYVGLISLKLDKIGITAEAGAYVRLWGYFFYHLEWAQGSGKRITSSGALLVESGIYLEIKFVAQAFSSNKLTWNPTLYSHEWPLWRAGEQQNVYAFSKTDDTAYTLVAVRSVALPGSTYDMKSMNLKSGATGVISRDDGAESSFDISFTNPAFSYEPATNTVTLVPPAGSLEEETDMVITWKKAALSFTSMPIQKVIHLSWSDPDGMRYISFDSMGGSAVEQLAAGSGAALTWPEKPTRQGYTFTGWYTDTACTRPYDGMTDTMPEFDGETKGITLYAGWTPAEVGYTVEHYLEEINGTYRLEAAEQKRGKTGELTAAQAYETVYAGFAGKPVTQQSIAADGSTRVEVYYERKKYSVEFVRNDGSTERSTQISRYGETPVLPLPAREGYLFDGWYTAATGGTLISGGVKITGNTTYYAHWTGAENIILFDSMGGSAVNAEIVRTDEKITQPANPVREGYEFSAWCTSQTGREQWNFTNGKVAGAMTLYAKWTVKRYAVTFDACGGSCGTTGKQVTYDKTYGALPVPTRMGYDFTGWYTAETGGEQITAQTLMTKAEAHTLYAHWKEGAATYTVKHYRQNLEDDEYTLVSADTESGKAGITGKQTAAVAKTYEGFTAQPISQQLIAADGTTVVNVYYDRKLYTVTWKSGDSIKEKDTNVKYGAKPEYNGTTPAKTAEIDRTYQFAGWNTKEDGSGSTLTGEVTVEADMTLYAQFNHTMNRYSVTFEANGGSAVDAQTVEHGQKPEEPSDPEKNGYTFEGWYKEAECINPWSFESDTVTGATTLYANWEAQRYAIWYYLNGGENDENAPASYTYGVGIQTLPTPARTDYVFLGWYTDSTLNVRVESISGTQTGVVTLYAKWQDDSVSYDCAEIMGQAIKASRIHDVLGDGTGSVQYDPETNVLTLNNATLESDAAAALIKLDKNEAGVYPQIVVKGTNTIRNTKTDTTGGGYVTGITMDSLYHAANNKASISGSGTLNVSVADNPDGTVIAIYGGTGGACMRIDGPTVTAEAGNGRESYGLLLYSNLYSTPSYTLAVSSGSLTAKGHTRAVWASEVRERWETWEEKILTVRVSADYNGTGASSVEATKDNLAGMQYMSTSN